MRDEIEEMMNMLMTVVLGVLILSIAIIILANVEGSGAVSEIDFVAFFNEAKSILLFIVIPVACKIISFAFKVADILQLPVEIRKTVEQISKVIGKNRQGKEEEKSTLVWDKKKKRFVS